MSGQSRSKGGQAMLRKVGPPGLGLGVEVTVIAWPPLPGRISSRSGPNNDGVRAPSLLELLTVAELVPCKSGCPLYSWSKAAWWADRIEPCERDIVNKLG